MNLVEMGMKAFGPNVVEKIAGMLGIESPMVMKAISTALPAILAAVSGRAAQGDGAAGMMSFLSDAPEMSADGFAGSLDGASVDDLASQGSGMLSDLLGGEDAGGALAKAIGASAGLPEDKAGSLLGMMAPAVTGMLKGQVAEGGLDAGGLAGLLGDQGDNIAAAMPAGLAESLGGTGLLDGIQDKLASLGVGAVGAGAAAAAVAGSVASSAGDAVSDAASAAASAAGDAADAATDAAAKVADTAGSTVSAAGSAASSAMESAESAVSGGGMGWIKWVAIAAVVVVLLLIIF